LQVNPNTDFDTRVEEMESTLDSSPRAQSVFRRTIRTINLAKVTALRDKYAENLKSFDHRSELKYADVPYWIHDKAKLAVTLNIDRRKGISVLDIGGRAGHFLKVCDALGHYPVGVGASVPFYNDACAALDVDCRAGIVRRQELLPNFGTRFDLVTIVWQTFDIIFDSKGSWTYWSIDDWAFLLRDIVDNHLRYPGEIYIQLNQQTPPSGMHSFDVALLDWAASIHGMTDRSRGIIHFTAVNPMSRLGTQLRPLRDFQCRADEIQSLCANDSRESKIFRRTIDKIDPSKISELQQKYATQLANFDTSGQYKYADVPFWIHQKVARVISLDLDRREPISILDVGMGAGHFPKICDALGHRTVGLDVANPFYRDMCAALMLDQRIGAVRRQEKLPYFGIKFDLITIFWQVFDIIKVNSDNSREYWLVKDWEFLLDDLTQTHLSPNGEIYIELNQRIFADGTQSFDNELLDWAEDHGGHVQRNRGIIRLSGLRSRPEAASESKSETRPSRDSGSQPVSILGWLRRL
jgi:hypothetical protein